MNAHELKLPGIPFVYAGPFIEEAEAKGLDVAELFSRCGFEYHPEHRAHDLIPPMLMYKFIDQVQRATNNPYLSFQIGVQRATRGYPGSKSFVELFKTPANLLLGWLHAGRQMQAQLSVTRHRAVFDVSRSVDPGEKVQFGNATVIGWFIGSLMAMKAADWDADLIVVRFGHPELIDPTTIAPENVVKTEDNNFSLILPTGWLVQSLSDRPVARTELEPISNRIRAALLELDLSTSPSADVVASTIGVSTKNMQQALKIQGKSYKVLLEDTKRELAIVRLMDSQNSVTDVAFSLGYSDTSNFVRAFRSWTGETPTNFRKIHSDDA